MALKKLGFLPVHSMDSEEGQQMVEDMLSIENLNVVPLL